MHCTAGPDPASAAVARFARTGHESMAPGHQDGCSPVRNIRHRFLQGWLGEAFHGRTDCVGRPHQRGHSAHYRLISPRRPRNNRFQSHQLSNWGESTRSPRGVELGVRSGGSVAAPRRSGGLRRGASRVPVPGGRSVAAVQSAVQQCNRLCNRLCGSAISCAALLHRCSDRARDRSAPAGLAPSGSRPCSPATGIVRPTAGTAHRRHACSR